MQINLSKNFQSINITGLQRGFVTNHINSFCSNNCVYMMSLNKEKKGKCPDEIFEQLLVSSATFTNP